jgi:hypothetical protein
MKRLRYANKEKQAFLRRDQIQPCWVTEFPGYCNGRSDVTRYRQRRVLGCDKYNSSLLAGIARTVGYNKPHDVAGRHRAVESIYLQPDFQGRRPPGGGQADGVRYDTHTGKRLNVTRVCNQKQTDPEDVSCSRLILDEPIPFRNQSLRVGLPLFRVADLFCAGIRQCPRGCVPCPLSNTGY